MQQTHRAAVVEREQARGRETKIAGVYIRESEERAILAGGCEQEEEISVEEERTKDLD